MELKNLLCIILFVLINSLQFANAQSTSNRPSYNVGSIFTTAKSTTKKLEGPEKISFTIYGQPLETEVCVFVDPTKKYQTITGIGGAITDAAAETFDRLPTNKQNQLLEAYYHPYKGIAYSLARTHIHSCDFSSSSYTYVTNNDKSLQSFNIDRDKQFRIPLIKQAIKMAGGRLTLYVSPWSPPAWMKDNNSMLLGGKLLAAFRQSWADYYVKFIQAYVQQDIPVWGLTVQNEPMATQKWESCIFTASEERDFIKDYLGPTLAKAGLGNKKLIAWDHNRDLIYQRASNILSDTLASKYIWGIGYHWYETWTGSSMQFGNIQAVQDAYPTTNLMLTEACIEKFDFKRIYDWSLGEQYGYSMINDFNNGAVGWTDWNILLNEQGGPNHAGNFCFAPVIADTRTGELHFTNSFYYIGHFSKFIKPGAKRIATSTNRDSLIATAFENINGKLAIVVMNRGDQSINYRLFIGDKASLVKSLPHSISSVIVE